MTGPRIPYRRDGLAVGREAVGLPRRPRHALDARVRLLLPVPRARLLLRAAQAAAVEEAEGLQLSLVALDVGLALALVGGEAVLVPIRVVVRGGRGGVVVVVRVFVVVCSLVVGGGLRRFIARVVVGRLNLG